MILTGADPLLRTSALEEGDKAETSGGRFSFTDAPSSEADVLQAVSARVQECKPSTYAKFKLNSQHPQDS